MNWQHVRAFVWLRWRLMLNQWRRGGAFNAFLMTIVSVGALVVAVPLFIACLLLGAYLIPEAAPVHLLMAWDGLIVGFLFFWGIGLVTELQRTEPLSLSKFLHLPVSVKSAFLINYVSSLVRLSLLVYVPAMLGYCVALVYAKGVSLLVALPLLAAFLLMITALTYQFQGWLASLMNNPRRRRTVVVATMAAFMLIFQLPSLFNFVRPWGTQERADRSRALVEEFAELNRAVQAHEIDQAEVVRRQHEINQRYQLAAKEAERENAEYWTRTARLMNLVVPAGWLPLGVMTAAEGRVLPGLLCLLGMTLIGSASLWRAYRTTIRLYQGQFTAGKRRAAPAALAPAGRRKTGTIMLEARLPWMSEPVSAVALGSLRSLTRSPEAKMMLLTLVLMGAIFGGTLLRVPAQTPDIVRPLFAIGGMVAVLFGMLQLMANQFGFDRDGFRVFVLCAAPRRDILLGKNLAFAPLALGMAAIVLVVVQVVCPLRIDRLLAMIPQYVSMFLVFCILTNLLSIYAPMHIAAGSLKPANPKLRVILLQMAMFVFLFPLSQVPTLIPLGIEVASELQGWTTNAPICLVLSLAECVALVFIYRVALDWQGGLLQAREQKILEGVTNRAP